MAYEELLENLDIIDVLSPDADRWNGSPATDVVNTKLYNRVTFVVIEGAGGTGTTTLTAEECTSAAGAGATAIAFNYRVAASPDTWGARTAATSAGYLTIAGADKMIAIEVNADNLSEGSPFVRVQTTEGDSTAVDAVIFAICSRPRYATPIPKVAVT